MDLTALGVLFVIVLAGFAVAVALMMLGQRLAGRCMRGSCGGPGAVAPDGQRLSCADCPNRDRPVGHA